MNKLIIEFEELELSSQYFMAKKFKELNTHHNYIYSSNQGWYEYNQFNILINYGNQYPLNLNQEITIILQNELKRIYKNMIDHVDPNHQDFKKYNTIYKSNFKNLGSSFFKEGIMKELKIIYLNNNIEKIIDSNNNLLAFNNMLFDFKYNRFRSIDKTDYICNHINYPAPTNKNLTIRQELMSLFKSIFDKEDIVNYFLDTIAFSCFTNEREKLYLWSGSGGNGKGLLLNLISKAFNNYFYIPDSQFLTTKYKSGSSNPSLYNVANKKLVMVSEPEGDDSNEVKFNIEFIKKVTGRDEITCRDMYKSNITYSPNFTLFVQCNQKPTIDKLDNGLKRRFEILEFPFQFVDNPTESYERPKNNSLKAKLDNLTYYSEFMGMLIDHVKERFNEREFKLPMSVSTNTNNYLESNNETLEFLNEYVEITKNKKDKIKFTDLYKKYCESDYIKLCKAKFKTNLSYNKLNVKRTNCGMCVEGVVFKNSLDYDSSDDEPNNLDIY